MDDDGVSQSSRGAGFLQRETHRHHATDGRNGLPADRLLRSLFDGCFACSTSMRSFVTIIVSCSLKMAFRTVIFAVLSMISPKGHCKTTVVSPCSFRSFALRFFNPENLRLNYSFHTIARASRHVFASGSSQPHLDIQTTARTTQRQPLLLHVDSALCLREEAIILLHAFVQKLTELGKFSEHVEMIRPVRMLASLLHRNPSPMRPGRSGFIGVDE